MLRGEDRGFMAALAQLVAGAKRPIVLTSNAHSLPSLVDAPLPTGTSGDGLQLARVRFRSPSAADAAVYASLVAAAEGRRVSPGEIAAACESKSGDVRRALLSAQFAASNPRASILIPRKRVSVMALEEPGLAGAASRLIARVDPRVSAAEATAPAMAVKALRALTRSASLEDRRAERTAEEAAVRRRAEVVADAAAAKAERAMRNEIRIEKGVLGKALRGSLGLVAAEVVPEADSAQEGDQSEEDAEAKVAAAANAARDAFLVRRALGAPLAGPWPLRVRDLPCPHGQRELRHLLLHRGRGRGAEEPLALVAARARRRRLGRRAGPRVALHVAALRAGARERHQGRRGHRRVPRGRRPAARCVARGVVLCGQRAGPAGRAGARPGRHRVTALAGVGAATNWDAAWASALDRLELDAVEVETMLVRLHAEADHVPDLPVLWSPPERLGPLPAAMAVRDGLDASMPMDQRQMLHGNASRATRLVGKPTTKTLIM